MTGSLGYLLCSLVRKGPQNVEKVARFPGGEKKRRILSHLWLSWFLRSRENELFCRVLNGNLRIRRAAKKRKTCTQVQGAKKNPKAKKSHEQHPIISEQFEGTTQSNKGFEANRTRKFTQKFSRIFVAQVLWGTFSAPDKSSVFFFWGGGGEACLL